MRIRPAIFQSLVSPSKVSLSTFISSGLALTQQKVQARPGSGAVAALLPKQYFVYRNSQVLLSK